MIGSRQSNGETEKAYGRS